MRPGTVHDLPGVYRVCLLTGAAGEDASVLHDDPDLLGHVWAGPYLAFPDAVTRVLRDDLGVAGYCLAVPDTVAFERWVDDVWLPPLRERHPVGSGTTPADAALVERLHHPTRSDAGLLAAHPAHLHVDLLPRLQGQGWGRRVVEAVLDGLTRAGATGVHLGVDEANRGAQAFYERLGFSELSGPPGARFYAMVLPPASG
ncbi:MAG TPA: GNAT family N-acetyltransferase [Ornithinibacter sp.]|nr:GNAT family N-acetyltransferase [Ornithinibacter sp.]